MVNFVELTKVGVCAMPLYVTVELATKFVPLMVSVCAVAPTGPDDGKRLVMLGTELEPAPLSGIDCRKPEKLPDTVRVSLIRPADWGAKMTEMLQL